MMAQAARRVPHPHKKVVQQWQQQEAQVLATLERYVDAHGTYPSHAELETALGHGRARTLRRALQALEDRGVVRTRAVVLLGRPGQVLTAPEIAWCHRNPSRVRAMMALAGATSTGLVT